MQDMSDRERAWRRTLQYGLRMAAACALAGLLLGLTVRERGSPQPSYPARAYLAAVLAIIGAVGGGAIVVVSFILNVIWAGRRARSAP
jgi:hypothetical protein